MRNILFYLGLIMAGVLIPDGLGAQTADSMKKQKRDVVDVEVSSASCAEFPGGCDVYFAIPHFGCGGVDALLRSGKGGFVPVILYRRGHPNHRGRREWFSSDDPPRTLGNRFAGRQFIDIPAGWRCEYRWQSDADILKKALPSDQR